MHATWWCDLLGLFVCFVCVAASATSGLRVQDGDEPAKIPAVGRLGKNNGVVVNDCSELREALLSGATRVYVQNDIRCTREEWGGTVTIDRNIELCSLVSATSTAPEAESSSVATVDWTDLTDALVAENAAVVYVHSLNIQQAKMPNGGLKLDFVRTHKGATAVFAGVLVVVHSCPIPVLMYDVLAQRQPRPEFMAGSQSTSVLNEDTLLVENYVLSQPHLDSAWHLCNTVFLCDGTTSPQVHEIRRNMHAYVQGPGCSSSNTNIGSSGVSSAVEPLRPLEELRHERYRHRRRMGIAAACVVGVLIALAVAVGVVLHYLNRTTRHWRLREEFHK